MTDDEIRSSMRRVSAGPIFDEVWSDSYYQFVQECFGAYKLEFTWGLANWAHISDSPTAFGYTNWIHADKVDYDLPDYSIYDTTMYSEGLHPVVIEFDIPDFCRAVREYATAYDDITDGSAVMARQEALEKLRIWRAEINTLCGQLENELENR